MAARKKAARRRHGLDTVGMADGGKVGETSPNRRMLPNTDPTRAHETVIPNAYRGKLQPDFENGKSLPEVYDAKKSVRT